MLVEERRSPQLLRGVLDMCLLALIAEAECYGYEMVSKLEARGLHLVSEGSIYPILSRLLRAGLIESFLVPSSEGPPRKYYRVLPKGRAALGGWVGEWQAFARSVDRVVER